MKEIQETFSKYNLHVNVEKTELTTISRKDDNWKNIKKLGSLLGDKEDIENRKHLSRLALRKLNNVWIRKVKKKTKLKLYNTLVKSVLLYNSSTWGMTKTDENKINAFHRKQLRIILGIHYPTKISNKSLYNKCNETPISLQILEARWRLFGHILRRTPEIPANKAMNFYFSNQGPKQKGRPVTTLLITLNNDLKRITGNNILLTSYKDLENLREIATNRQEWRVFCTEIKKAAEAATSDDQASERQ